MTEGPRVDDVPLPDEEWDWCAEWEDTAAALPATTDEDVLAGLTGPAHEADLATLASIDVTALAEPLDRIDYLRALDRVAGLVAAMQAEAVLCLAGAVPARAYLDEVHVEHELAVARRTSRYAAGRTIETARALASTFPAFRDALRAGEVSPGHAAVLVERTRPVTDPDALAGIERVALDKARRMTVGEFAREVSALVARFDPAGAAERARRARDTRGVRIRALEDGMGFLGLTHDWPTIAAIERVVRADGRTLQRARRAETITDGSDGARTPASTSTEAEWDDEDPRADACRADALAARILGTLADDGSTTWDPASATVEVQLVIDLATLRAETDHPCLLDGQPIPADLGRDLAGHARAFRRLVTDPVTGHLLDYGRLVYQPAPLRTYTLARDGGCRAPVCGVHDPARLDNDHAHPFPDGPSDAANLGALCRTCHQLKTAGHAHITHSRADGSCTWTTAWGQVVHIPPRPVLPAHDDPPRPQPPPHINPPPRQPPPDADPPPF